MTLIWVTVKVSPSASESSATNNSDPELSVIVASSFTASVSFVAEGALLLLLTVIVKVAVCVAVPSDNV